MPYTEPVPVPDIFVTGLANIETAGGGCLRFTFCSHQESLMHGGDDDYVVVARLVIPAEHVQQMAVAALTACRRVFALDREPLH